MIIRIRGLFKIFYEFREWMAKFNLDLTLGRKDCRLCINKKQICCLFFDKFFLFLLHIIPIYFLILGIYKEMMQVHREA